MKLLTALCLLAAFLLAGCDEDPARKVKIETPPVVAPPGAPPAAPPAPARTVADAEGPRPTDNIVHATPAKPRKPRASTPAADWRPAGCPPLPESETGTGLVTVTGPCAFEHRSAVSCEATADDFLVTMSRAGADGSTVMIFINVEKYAGPGTYDGGQMFLGVQDKKNIYRWSSDTVAATVGPEGASVTLPITRLEAEPLFVNCSGPMTNFQCEDRDVSTALDGTVEVVGGTFTCTKRD
jgi:hypothetical protein